MRSYLCTVDLIIWLLNILTRARNRSIYNVGSNVGVTIADLAKLTSEVAQKNGYHGKITIAQKPNPEHRPPAYIPDINAAIHDLSLRVFTPLETALQRTIDFYKQGAA